MASLTRRSTTRPRSTRPRAQRTTTKKSSSDRAWESLAQREPYFAVLTDGRFRAENLTDEAREAFFATGEADIAHVFAILGDNFAARDALDFGCGVGRLTRALRKRVGRVVGVDVSPRMLELAGANVPDATFGGAIPLDEFDLIVSLIVLQHIPVSRGMAILRELLQHLRPGGAIAIHVTTRRRGGALRRAARRLRARFPALHQAVSRLEGNHDDLPYMEMNEYDDAAVREEIRSAHCSEVAVESTDHGGIPGMLIVARKS